MSAAKRNLSLLPEVSHIVRNGKSKEVCPAMHDRIHLKAAVAPGPGMRRKAALTLSTRCSLFCIFFHAAFMSQGAKKIFLSPRHRTIANGASRAQPVLSSTRTWEHAAPLCFFVIPRVAKASCCAKPRYAESSVFVFPCRHMLCFAVRDGSPLIRRLGCAATVPKGIAPTPRLRKGRL
jgi:hypothetical protein